jgi:hypothetical protein
VHSGPCAARRCVIGACGPRPKGTIAWTFNRAGSFEFACLIPGHFEADMPIGSPGVDGPEYKGRKDAYDVLLV